MSRLFSLTLGLLALLFLFQASTPAAKADGLPKIAVTDLTYEERVSSYFSYVEAHSKDSLRANRSSVNASHEDSLVAVSGEITSIERGEMHKFTGDVRGALIRSGNFRVVEGKPWTGDGSVKIFDVLDRIKKGMYAGADYVLFGTITDINSRNQAIPIQGSNAVNAMLSMELVVDFKLINTKTHEIAAAFTAMGEGQDARLVNMAGTVFELNRGKVMRDVSASLGDQVLQGIQSQFGPSGGVHWNGAPINVPDGQPPAQNTTNGVGPTVVFH